MPPVARFGCRKDETMSKRLYIGNLPHNTTELVLRQAFAAWAPTEVTLPMDDGGHARGFGFIEIPQDDQAAQAIEAMNGKELDGRALTVSEARPRRGGSGSGGRRW
jgi:RNA recognition motif-containing protein